LVRNHYANFKKFLYDLVVVGNMKHGIINYDSTTGRLQLKDTNVLNLLYVNGVDFYDVKLSGYFDNCLFSGCDISESDVYKSKFVGRDKILKSNLNRCVITGDGNKINDSYLYKCFDVMADIKKSVLKSCTTDYNVVIDKKTKMI